MLDDGILRLRAPEPSDVDRMFLWENDTRYWKVGSAVAPLSRQQIWDYVSNYDGNIFASGQLRMMIDEIATGETVGIADLFDFDALNRRSSVGLLVDSSYSGRGYGRRAMTLLETYASERLGLHQLWCIIPAENMSCRALFDRLGYTISGRLRSWVRTGESYADAYLYQRFI